MHRIDLHGPSAGALASSIGFELAKPMQATQVGDGALAWRLDRIAEEGVSLCVPAASAQATWNALQASAQGLGCTLRTVGWFAFNMARVEAHEPMANIDFGPGNLPAETGVLHRRVSFEKGCYPGQEVVARMHNLGHPKQVLRRLELPHERLPIAGGQVFAGDDVDLATPVGAVTSSAPAPLSSQRAVAMAMLRWKAATPGRTVRVMTDGEAVEAIVQEIES
jgi:folate-binding protein YgfZ